MDELEENFSEDEEETDNEESSVDDGEISPEEDAFIHGHDEANDLKEDGGEKEDEEESKEK